MKVLLIGSGGREHALAWALSASPLLTKLYCAPGNAGFEQVAECVPIPAMDFDRLVAFAQEKKIDFVVIAPDDPLVGGLWDRFEAAGVRASGPSRAGAILEGSKGFVKDLCREVGITRSVIEPSMTGTRIRFFLACSRPLRIASGTSLALPKP